MRDTRHNMQTRGHMKRPGNCLLGCILSSTDRQALFFATLPLFWGYLTLKSCTCSTGATGMDIRGRNCEKLSVLHDPGYSVMV